jgi:hypothetical protein
LLARQVTLEARAHELENERTAETKAAEQRLIASLCQSVSELANMVELCEQRATGSDVNVALLFGRRGNHIPPLCRHFETMTLHFTTQNGNYFLCLT